MAGWGDVVGLIFVSTLFFGAIAAFVYVTESAKKAAAETDSGLRAKGVTITESGIAVKLNKPAPTREEIIESQSRAFLKGGEVLARPGVVSAGHQAAFRDSKPEVPNAFGADAETDAQKRAHFRRHRSREGSA